MCVFSLPPVTGPRQDPQLTEGQDHRDDKSTHKADLSGLADRRRRADRIGLRLAAAGLPERSPSALQCRCRP
jgi:hypothetical protein